MSRMKRLKLSLVIVALIAIAGWAVWVAFPSPDRQLAALADNYFEQYYYPMHPTSATAAGIHRYDDQMEDYSKKGINREIATLAQYEKQFAAVDTTKLSVHAQDNLELILNSIRGTLLTLQDIRPWEKNPDIYTSNVTTSIFVIISRKFAPPAARLQAVIEREKKIPAVFAAARDNIHNPPKIYTEVALEQLPGIISFFEKDVPAAFADVDDEKLKQKFVDSNKIAIQALKDYEEWLNQHLILHSNGNFRLGADVFKKKLWFDEMIDMSLDDLIALNAADMKKNQDEFKRIAKDIDPKKSPQQILTMLASNHPQTDKVLASFQATFAELIRFIQDKHIISLPTDRQPILEESPPFLRAITFASMDTPGPFEKVAKEAYFNVTLPSAEWPQGKRDDFLKLFNYPVISNISVHEAYPGHYVQFLWVPHIHDRVRKILGASSNAEGWAHYCEQMMLDEGYGANKSKRELNMLRLGQLQNALLRNARFYVGIKLHTTKMTIEEAQDFFVKEGYQARTTGIVETKRGTFDPTYLYYTLGKLQILKLRADMKAKEGDKFNLEAFHNNFMLQGFPPIKIVRREMLG